MLYISVFPFRFLFLRLSLLTRNSSLFCSVVAFLSFPLPLFPSFLLPLFFYFPRLEFFQLFRSADMSDLAHGSCSGGRRSTAGRDSSPARYPPPYDITTYLQEYQAYLYKDRFARLLSARAASTVPFGVGVRSTTVGA